jgi:hypothetical protein
MWSISQAFLFDKGFIKCLEKRIIARERRKEESYTTQTCSLTERCG